MNLPTFPTDSMADDCTVKYLFTTEKLNVIMIITWDANNVIDLSLYFMKIYFFPPQSIQVIMIMCNKHDFALLLEPCYKYKKYKYINFCFKPTNCGATVNQLEIG